MATPTQSRAQQPQAKNGQATAKAAATPLVDAILDAKITYKPFMSDDEISLSPRMVLQYLCKPTKSGKICTHEQAVKFVRLCQARALNPWEGDAFIVGYDSKDGPEFNLVTAHQAFLKRAEVHPEYDGLESGVTVIGPGGTLEDLQGDLWPDGWQIVGGWAKVHFKNRSVPMYKRLKLGAFNKGHSRWAVDPGGMIVKCAEADALRSSFPTRLGGMYLREEFDAVEQGNAKPAIPMPAAISEKATVPVPEVVAPPVTEPESPPDHGDAYEGPIGGEMFAGVNDHMSERR